MGQESLQHTDIHCQISHGMYRRYRRRLMKGILQAERTGLYGRWKAEDDRKYVRFEARCRRHRRRGGREAVEAEGTREVLLSMRSRDQASRGAFNETTRERVKAGRQRVRMQRARSACRVPARDKRE